MNRALRICLSLSLLLILEACSPASSALPATNAPVTVLPRADRPNILLILTDDLDSNLGTLDYMPNLQRVLKSQGLTIEDYFSTTPVCCPARSSILRGQYAHNHQVFTNAAPVGGFGKFHSLANEASTVAVWLQAAGYRTALFGKYLNGYPFSDNRTYIPPGWTEWYSPARGTPYREFNYYLNENGRIIGYGLGENEYMTDVLSQKVVDFLGRSTSAQSPFFIYLSTYAPHEPAIPAPRHSGLFADLQIPRLPAFDEADVSDKVTDIKGNPPLDPAAIQNLDELYRQRVRSMQAVDEMIARLVETLEGLEQLQNTYIIFTSDNGFHMGQHRLNSDKGTPYEEDITVPFIIRGPGIPAGETLQGYLAGIIDLAPTLADLAGVVPPDFVDGRSLVPLWLPNLPDQTHWRRGLLIEYFGSENETASSSIQPVGLGLQDQLLEPPDPDEIMQTAPKVHFLALRTDKYLYSEYPDGQIEFYDLENDPYQLENLGPSASPGLLEKYSAWLKQLASCSAASCRSVEQMGIR